MLKLKHRTKQEAARQLMAERTKMEKLLSVELASIPMDGAGIVLPGPGQQSLAPQVPTHAISTGEHPPDCATSGHKQRAHWRRSRVQIGAAPEFLSAAVPNSAAEKVPAEEAVAKAAAKGAAKPENAKGAAKAKAKPPAVVANGKGKGKVTPRSFRVAHVHASRTRVVFCAFVWCRAGWLTFARTSDLPLARLSGCDNSASAWATR